MSTIYNRLAHAIDIHHACNQPVMLWSDPGMGKTSFVTNTLAGRDTVTYPTTGQTLPVAHCQTIIPAAMDSGDLLGIPTIEKLNIHASSLPHHPNPYNTSTMYRADTVDAATTFDDGGFTHIDSTEFATPSWALEANSYAPYGIAYVLVDEFPAAPTSIHNIFLNIIEDRRLPNGFQLHDNVKFVLAGNMNRSGVRGMTELSSAMTSRLAHYSMEPSLNDWSHGMSTGFGSAMANYQPLTYTGEEVASHRAEATAQVLSFLDAHPSYFNAAEARIDRTRGWYNPRTWQRVTDILTYSHGVDHDIRMSMVEALVGMEARTHFSAHIDTLTMPTTDDILKNPFVLDDLDSASAFVSLSTLFAVMCERSRIHAEEVAEKEKVELPIALATVVIPEESSPMWDLISCINHISPRHDNIIIGQLTAFYEKMFTYVGSRILNPSTEGAASLDNRFVEQQKSLREMFNSLNAS